MEEVGLFSTSADPLLVCLMCKGMLHEAVQLKCLHNYCRQCFNAALSTVDCEGVSCAACGSITEAGSEQPNGFIDDEVQRYRAIAASRVCGVCQGNGERDKPALLWCPTCRHSLCGECVDGHRQYLRQHDTKLLEELSTLDEVCMQSPTSLCAAHKKPLEIACRDCEQAKCVTCSAECMVKKHKIYVAGKQSFDTYVGKFISSIACIESELLRKSEVLEKAKIRTKDTTVARDRHLEEIGMRKRRVVDAIAILYHEIETATKNAYEELEAERDAAAALADRIETNLSDTRSYIRRLVESDDKCAIINQQKIVHERLSYFLTELEKLRKRLSTTREVKVESSLPDNVEDFVRAWIGIPRAIAASPSPAPASSPQLNKQQSSQQQQQQQLVPASSSLPHPSQQLQQSYSFGPASVTFRMPVNCTDVALTPNGRRLLLAALEHGLIKVSSASGRLLCRWWPPKLSSGRDDSVLAVAALCDRRAAVSLLHAQLVVLLRRNEKISGSSSTGRAAAGGNEWTEDRRIQLPWYAVCLSAHGDVLAACGWLGRRLRLLRLSSERQLSDTELQHGYRIGSLAVTARLLVTGSYSKVELGGGRRAAPVLDAHRIDAYGGSDERLWRHVLSSSNQQEEELPWGICTDSNDRFLYAAVCRSDSSSGRVSVLSLADGSELRRVALSFQSAAAASTQLLLLPRRLSLSDVGAAAEQRRSHRRKYGRALLLAALCWCPATKEWKTVTLHRSTNDMLQ